MRGPACPASAFSSATSFFLYSQSSRCNPRKRKDEAAMFLEEVPLDNTIIPKGKTLLGRIPRPAAFLAVCTGNGKVLIKKKNPLGNPALKTRNRFSGILLCVRGQNSGVGFFLNFQVSGGGIGHCRQTQHGRWKTGWRGIRMSCIPQRASL